MKKILDLRSVAIYYVVFVIAMFVFVISQPVGAQGIGKLFAWVFNLCIAMVISAPVHLVSALMILFASACKLHRNVLAIYVFTALLGILLSPLIGGLATLGVCQSRPLVLVDCIFDSYSVDAWHEKIGYAMVYSQALAFISVLGRRFSLRQPR